MLAIGVGAADMPKYLNSLDEDVTSHLAIACKNSPASVTTSSSKVDITLLKKKLDQSSIFAQQLKTGKVYHSQQIEKDK
ncbi:hypothetical protein LZ30DRAFT_671108 [Colletotrichum cereale]|nr:hypothetical protein LZ30DRAFT_671108 [Colletotrichum cereale]